MSRSVTPLSTTPTRTTIALDAWVTTDTSIEAPGAAGGSRFAPLWSSADGKWTTPRDRWKEWDIKLGPFTLDAAALATSTLCADWLGPDHPEPLRRDALAFDHWVGLAGQAGGGAVWCNPPYALGVAEWCRRAAETARHGTRAVMLLPSRTGTRWFHDHVLGQCDIEFLRGRLKFGDARNSAPFDSMLLVY